MDDLSTSAVPLRCGSAVIGFVWPDRSVHRGIAGLLTPGPDFAAFRLLFERAVEAAKRVDSASDLDYQSEWYSWSESLKPINALELTFGERDVPVEAFEIDGHWRVEFSIALWWQVEQDLTGGDTATEEDAKGKPS